jgi:two-component system sensor histidine kinase PilS (NtrC family)
MSKEYVSKRLQWLMFLRVVFTTVLLGSTIFVQFQDRESLLTYPHLFLYGLIATVYILTFFYIVVFKRFGPTLPFAYAQIGLDTALVTLLIYVTGGIASVFSFLYLVVIVYASILLYKKGSLIMATACSIQYGVIIDLEYYGILEPFYTQAGFSAQAYEASFLLYKIIMTMLACFLVAFLSSHLAQQALRTEKELKARQEDLKQLEAFNANIVHSMDSGLLTLDSQNTITSLNRAAEEITGFKRKEVVGKPLAAIFPGAVAHLVAPGEFLQRRPQRYDVEFKKKDGTIGYLGFSVSSLVEPDGRAIGKLLIFQDLTALKIMEAHIKRVDKLAAVGEMAAGIAHEIKNPLASMTGSVQLLKGEISMTSVTQKLMQIVLREADRLNGLANDFLLFARPSSGKTEAVELSSAIEETLELFEQDAMRQNRVRVVKHLGPDLWTEMDPKHMRQILWNLLLNAAEAIDGSGSIEVTTKIAEDLVEVAVKDDGCGMPEENLKKIFDPFFTSKAHGTGLGLSIVHRLLESCRGHIDVRSHEGQGTTFIVYLKRTSPPGLLP